MRQVGRLDTDTAVRLVALPSRGGPVRPIGPHRLLACNHTLPLRLSHRRVEVAPVWGNPRTRGAGPGTA
jgi:hypothetical protein